MVYTTRDNTSEQQRNNSKDKTASMQFTDSRPTTAMMIKGIGGVMQWVHSPRMI